jgi:hypothetical protein
MLVYGSKFWYDNDKFFTQVNNPTEEQLRKHIEQWKKNNIIAKDARVFWLETCGASTSANCLAATGYNIDVKTPTGYILQSDEVIADYHNDPRNYSKLKNATGVDPTVQPGNRVAAYYVVSAKDLFNAKAVHSTKFTRLDLIEYLKLGCALQVCINPPGHYVAIVGYDVEKNEFIYNDSWPTRKPEWNGNGFNRRFTKEEEATIVQEMVIYYP